MHKPLLIALAIILTAVAPGQAQQSRPRQPAAKQSTPAPKPKTTPSMIVEPPGDMAFTSSDGKHVDPATFSYTVKGTDPLCPCNPDANLDFTITGLPTWLMASALSGKTPMVVTFSPTLQYLKTVTGTVVVEYPLTFTSSAGTVTRIVRFTVTIATQQKGYLLDHDDGNLLADDADRLPLNKLTAE
jgi:hypothetical protein